MHSLADVAPGPISVASRDERMRRDSVSAVDDEEWQLLRLYERGQTNVVMKWRQHKERMHRMQRMETARVGSRPPVLKYVGPRGAYDW